MLGVTQLAGFGAGGRFSPNAVNFDGTNDFLMRDADLTSNSNSKLWTGSLWFKRGTTNVDEYIYGALFATGSGTPYIALRFTNGYGAADAFKFEGRDTSANLDLRLETADQITDSLWHNILFSFDMADTGKRHVYLDDVSSISVTTYNNDNLDFTRPDHAIGARGTNGLEFTGDLADFWLDSGTYIDFSVTANRRKFISGGGSPIPLGSDGSLPTGTAPKMFFSGDTDTWHTNDGSSGGFTENGALTTASSSP